MQITSGRNDTEWYETEGAAHIEVYFGDTGVKFPAPLVKATTNIKAGSVVVAKSERLAKPWKISDAGTLTLKRLESTITILQ